MGPEKCLECFNHISPYQANKNRFGIVSKQVLECTTWKISLKLKEGYKFIVKHNPLTSSSRISSGH